MFCSKKRKHRCRGNLWCSFKVFIRVQFIIETVALRFSLGDMKRVWAIVKINETRKLLLKKEENNVERENNLFLVLSIIFNRVDWWKMEKWNTEKIENQNPE